MVRIVVKESASLPGCRNHRVHRLTAHNQMPPGFTVF